MDFTIEVSSDSSNWPTVVLRTGYALPVGEEAFTFTKQSARYVRVQGINLRPIPNDSNFYRMQFAEVEIY